MILSNIHTPVFLSLLQHLCDSLFNSPRHVPEKICADTLKDIQLLYIDIECYVYFKSIYINNLKFHLSL